MKTQNQGARNEGAARAMLAGSVTAMVMALVMVSALVLSRPAAAQDKDPSFLTFSLGYFDILHNEDETTSGMWWNSARPWRSATGSTTAPAWACGSIICRTRGWASTIRASKCSI